MKNTLSISNIIIAFIAIVTSFQSSFAICDSTFWQNTSLIESSYSSEIEIKDLSHVYIINDQMFFSYEGIDYAIKSLEKMNDAWYVRIDVVGHCTSGHTLCRNCHQCHTPRCWNYVPRCNLWK